MKYGMKYQRKYRSGSKHDLSAYVGVECHGGNTFLFISLCLELRVQSENENTVSREEAGGQNVQWFGETAG